ncbi:MAG: hypothetical protein GXN94_00210 [Aquificae bacterium]|nr:hypothetical protein [Aquificota bacterium]
MALRLVALLTALLSTAYGHGLQVQVKQDRAVVIHIKYEEGQPFSFKEYTIYHSQEPEKPFAVGKTDRYGRVSFLPDRAGKWILKAFGEDGHGVVKEINIDGSMIGTQASGQDRLLKVLTGVAVIIGFFGAVGILRKKRWAL